MLPLQPRQTHEAESRVGAARLLLKGWTKDNGGHLMRPINRLEDVLFGGGVSPSTASLAEFWQWGFGDLCDDDVNGIFAEWVVHLLLDVPSKRRVSWANSDIITPSGIRVEVKSSSYWQSWKLINEFGQAIAPPSNGLPLDGKIRFSGLKARDATAPASGASPKAFKSDMYVFAFQAETDPNRWNAMDLSQWEFYVFSVEELSQFAGQSVSLKKLRERQAPLSAAEFSVEGKQLLAKLSARAHIEEV